jgi:flagellar assembly protein FliH
VTSRCRVVARMSSLHNEGVLRGSAASQATPFSPQPFSVRRSEVVAVEVPGVELDQVYADELARLRAQAREEGFREGYSAGQESSQADFAASVVQARDEMAREQADWTRHLDSVAEALAGAVAKLDEATVPLAEELSVLISSYAFEVAEQIIGRELACATDPGRDAVSRALMLAPGDAPIVVRVNPADYAALDSAWVASLPSRVSVAPDRSVEAAGAVAAVGAVRIDAQLSAAVGRVRDVLAR